MTDNNTGTTPEDQKTKEHNRQWVKTTLGFGATTFVAGILAHAWWDVARTPSDNNAAAPDVAALAVASAKTKQEWRLPSRLEKDFSVKLGSSTFSFDGKVVTEKFDSADASVKLHYYFDGGFVIPAGEHVIRFENFGDKDMIQVARLTGCSIASSVQTTEGALAKDKALAQSWATKHCPKI